ncbi:MAG: hypothetical protein M1821_006459 [Bathelium mastoideum]|nr:MAG: hypothetical protein M1821_006459 [Bathelium mastoideum]
MKYISTSKIAGSSENSSEEGEPKSLMLSQLDEDVELFGGRDSPRLYPELQSNEPGISPDRDPNFREAAAPLAWEEADDHNEGFRPIHDRSQSTHSSRCPRPDLLDSFDHLSDPANVHPDPCESSDCPSEQLQHESPPIMQWLQETVPPIDPVKVHQKRDEAEHEQITAQSQEAQDLEYLRNVQITATTELVAPVEPFRNKEEIEEDEIGTQFFYRNILDRHPKIDYGLACYLAKLNWARAKRIAAPPIEINEENESSPIDQPKDVEDTRRSRISSLVRSSTDNYWTRQSHPSSSASSQNDSLRDAEIVDAEDQHPSRAPSFRGHMPEHEIKSPKICPPKKDSRLRRLKLRTNLPPLPAKSTFRRKFICDICGKYCKVRTTKDWKFVQARPFKNGDS